VSIVIEKESKYTSGNYLKKYDSDKSGGTKVGENLGGPCKYNKYYIVFFAILSINFDSLYSSLLIVFSSPEKNIVPSPGNKNTSKRHSVMIPQTTTTMQSFLDYLPSKKDEMNKICKL